MIITTQCWHTITIHGHRYKPLWRLSCPPPFSWCTLIFSFLWRKEPCHSGTNKQRLTHYPYHEHRVQRCSFQAKWFYLPHAKSGWSIIQRRMLWHCTSFHAPIDPTWGPRSKATSSTGLGMPLLSSSLCHIIHLPYCSACGEENGVGLTPAGLMDMAGCRRYIMI